MSVNYDGYNYIYTTSAEASMTTGNILIKVTVFLHYGGKAQLGSVVEQVPVGLGFKFWHKTVDSFIHDSSDFLRMLTDPYVD
jgi:hypothetical protein